MTASHTDFRLFVESAFEAVGQLLVVDVIVDRVHDPDFVDPHRGT